MTCCTSDFSNPSCPTARFSLLSQKKMHTSNAICFAFHPSRHHGWKFWRKTERKYSSWGGREDRTWKPVSLQHYFLSGLANTSLREIWSQSVLHKDLLADSRICGCVKSLTKTVRIYLWLQILHPYGKVHLSLTFFRHIRDCYWFNSLVEHRKKKVLEEKSNYCNRSNTCIIPF